MSVRELARRRFYAWFGWYSLDLIADESLERIHVRDAYVAGFVAGGAFALKTSAHLAGLVPRLDLLNELLGAELEARVHESEVPPTV